MPYDTIERVMKHFLHVFGVPLFMLLFVLLLKQTAYATDCTGAYSFCSLTQQSSDPMPGATCPDGNGNYVYGTTGNCGPGQSGTCVPRCGAVGNGWCCDPKQGYIPKNALPGCASSNASGGCTTVDTAIGPITTTPSGIAGSIMTILLSLSGGVAILLVIAAGYQMITSQGNPEKVKEARERLTSAIVGLLFIIFSVAILQIVGIDILHIPGLSR